MFRRGSCKSAGQVVVLIRGLQGFWMTDTKNTIKYVLTSQRDFHLDSAHVAKPIGEVLSALGLDNKVDRLLFLIDAKGLTHILYLLLTKKNSALPMFQFRT